MSVKPKNLGYKVSWRDINWLQLVQRAWGAEFTAPDHGVYEFSNGRKFDSTDKYLTGLYGVDCPYPLEFEYHYMNEAPHSEVLYYNHDMDTTLGDSDQRNNELLYIDMGGPISSSPLPPSPPVTTTHRILTEAGGHVLTEGSDYLDTET